MTLIEVTVAAAIGVVMAAALMQVAGGARPMAASSAASAFDAALAYAKSVAATSGNGATLVFTPASPGPGFTLNVFSGRPTGPNALAAAAAPPLVSSADVSEGALGAAPFTVFLTGSGQATAQRGPVKRGQGVISDPGCPPGETAVQLKFSAGQAAAVRTVPCSPR